MQPSRVAAPCLGGPGLPRPPAPLCAARSAAAAPCWPWLLQQLGGPRCGPHRPPPRAAKRRRGASGGSDREGAGSGPARGCAQTPAVHREPEPPHLSPEVPPECCREGTQGTICSVLTSSFTVALAFFFSLASLDSFSVSRTSCLMNPPGMTERSRGGADGGGARSSSRICLQEQKLGYGGSVGTPAQPSQPHGDSSSRSM